MATTYSQIINGKKIPYSDFEKNVYEAIKLCTDATYKFPYTTCKKLYNKGYSVSDAISFLILK